MIIQYRCFSLSLPELMYTGQLMVLLKIIVQTLSLTQLKPRYLMSHQESLVHQKTTSPHFNYSSAKTEKHIPATVESGSRKTSTKTRRCSSAFPSYFCSCDVNLSQGARVAHQAASGPHGYRHSNTSPVPQGRPQLAGRGEGARPRLRDTQGRLRDTVFPELKETAWAGKAVREQAKCSSLLLRNG